MRVHHISLRSPYAAEGSPLDELNVPAKGAQVLGANLNRSESSRPAATVCPASQRDRVLLERAADPLHRPGVDSKLSGNDADTGPPK